MPATFHEDEEALPQDLTTALTDGVTPRQDALRERIGTLLEALGHAPSSREPLPLQARLDRVMESAGPEESWLALAVITGRLPEPATVVRTVRAIRLDGPSEALFDELRRSGRLDWPQWPHVEVVSGKVVVDAHHTSRSRFATGIQRVTRELAGRWARDHELVFCGWTSGYESYRRLSEAEVTAACRGARKSWQALGYEALPDPREDSRGVLVPWRCTHVVPELPAEIPRALRYQGFLTYSGSTTGLVGYDCVPLTAAETCAEGMASGFAGFLAAAAHVDRVAAISEAAADDLRGWRKMLVGAGLVGPDIRAIPLPVEALRPSEPDLEEARRLLEIGSLPVVLSVGSREPRKNHLTLLQAAETLWREGLLFSLAFVGGNSWSSEGFDSELNVLRREGRPVQAILALPDNLLWAAYRLAYCTVFASLYEGFGLPVAESLASGTPVITSNYGSMRECASHGGALFVDPRDPADLTRTLRRLLQDRGLRDRLAAESARLPVRSWDAYAAETWEYLTQDGPGAGDCTHMP